MNRDEFFLFEMENSREVAFQFLQNLTMLLLLALNNYNPQKCTLFGVFTHERIQCEVLQIYVVENYITRLKDKLYKNLNIEQSKCI